MRKFVIVFIALFLALPALETKAQANWVVVFDFGCTYVPDPGDIVYCGTSFWNLGTGSSFLTGNLTSAGANASAYIELFQEVDVMWWQMNARKDSANASLGLNLYRNGPTPSWTEFPTDTNTTNNSFVWSAQQPAEVGNPTGTLPVTSLQIFLDPVIGNMNNVAGVRWLKISGPGDPPTPNNAWYIPVHYDDRQMGTDPLSQTFDSIPSTATWSDVPGQTVYSAVAGAISSIDRVRISMCDDYIGEEGGLLGFGVRHCPSLDDSGELHVMPQNILPFPYTEQDTEIEAYMVTVYAGDFNNFIALRYFIDDPALYNLKPGPISAGCKLGSTLAVIDTSEDGLVGAGLVTISVQVESATVDATNYFLLEPDDSAPPCGEPEGFDLSQCFNDDPDLLDITKWDSNKVIEFGNGSSKKFQMQGPTTPVDESYIQQILNLDDALDYEVVVIYYSESEQSGIGITLGEQSQSFATEPGLYDLAQIKWEVGSITADAGSFYTFRVEKLQVAADLLLDVVCVREVGGDDLADEGACTFADYSFDAPGDMLWDITGSYTWVPGELRLEDTGTFAQNLTLAAGDYKLTLIFGLYHGPSYSYMSQVGDIGLNIDFDSFSDTSGAYTYDTFAYDNEVVVEVDVSLGSSATDDFTFEVVDTGSETDIFGLAIRQVCLQSAGKNSPEEVVKGKCRINAHPQNDEFGAWITWHWKNLDGFFQCDLMKLLNKMYQLSLDFYNSFRFMLKWMNETTKRGISWLSSDLFPWLAGYLSNINPTSTTVQQSCDNIWCLLTDFLDLGNSLLNGIMDLVNRIMTDIILPIFNFVFFWINLIVTLLFEIVVAIINLFFLALTLLVQIVFELRDAISALLASWNNAEPIAIPGMWDCVNNPEDSAVCWTLWVAENTVFSGDVGSAIIPVFVSLASILLIIRWIKRIRKTIDEVGRNV